MRAIPTTHHDTASFGGGSVPSSVAGSSQNFVSIGIRVRTLLSSSLMAARPRIATPPTWLSSAAVIAMSLTSTRSG